MGIVDKFRTAKHLRTLRSPDRSSDRAVAEAKSSLITLGPAAVTPLLEHLSVPEARRSAQEILERVLTEKTLPTFVEAMAAGDRKVQDAIAEILVRSRTYRPMSLVGYLERPDVPKARLESILAQRADDLPPRDLLDLLPQFHREARSIVYRLLERYDDPSLAPAIVPLMKHEEWWIRVHMAKLLGRLGKPASVEALTHALKDANKNVRIQAIRSLQALEAKPAVAGLVPLLRDVDLTVQAAAIDALVSIGDASAVPHLVEVLKDESEHARRGAVEVLNEVATTEAIQDLVHSLRDADWWVRVRSADALGTIGGPRVVEAVLRLVEDDDVHIRRYAIEILNTIPDGRSVEPLIRALRDDDWWVRERSIDALGRTGDPRAVEPLAALLGGDEQTTTLAAKALGELGSADGVSALLPLLEGDPSSEKTRTVIDALVKIGKTGVPDEVRESIDRALHQHGIRLEKTQLKPMEVRQHSGEARPAGPSRGAASSSRGFSADNIESGMVLLERYEVVRKIGTGGFSSVFLVKDQVVAEEVILKILSPHLTIDENMNLRFVQELKIARRISHPNVIRIYDLLQIGKARAISMEYFDSNDLSEVLEQEGRIGPGRSLAITRQICDGLGAAHEAGVVHRDIKPANVLLGRDDTVKIVDFGLAAAEREVENRLTRTGHLVGTPHYMAPELIRGEEIGPRADIYSLGVLMYEMVTGNLPYDGDNPMNVLFRHLDGNAPPPRDIEPSVPAALSDVVMLAMAKEPEDRPHTAGELLRLLEGTRV